MTDSWQSDSGKVGSFTWCHATCRCFGAHRRRGCIISTRSWRLTTALLSSLIISDHLSCSEQATICEDSTGKGFCAHHFAHRPGRFQKLGHAVNRAHCLGLKASKTLRFCRTMADYMGIAEFGGGLKEAVPFHRRRLRVDLEILRVLVEAISVLEAILNFLEAMVLCWLFNEERLLMSFCYFQSTLPM